jgi:hypothetical protein
MIVREMNQIGIKKLITDKMPEGIKESEGGMRLLDNKEIRQLQDIISTTDFWQGKEDE